LGVGIVAIGGFAVGSQAAHALAGDVGVVVAVRELEKTPLVPLYFTRLRGCSQNPSM
jgi:hypothetical protein